MFFICSCQLCNDSLSTPPPAETLIASSQHWSKVLGKCFKIHAKQIRGSVSVFLWLFNGDNHVLFVTSHFGLYPTDPANKTLISYNHPKDPSTCVFFLTCDRDQKSKICQYG